jgi:DNA-binding NarL/FixJ family response regulator
MNTGARRIYRSDWSERKRTDGAHNGANGSAVGKRVCRVAIAAENRLLCEALTRMLSKEESLQVSCVNLSHAEGVEESTSQIEAEVLLLSATGQFAADLKVIQQVRTCSPKMRILLLGMNGNECEFLQCVRAGVSGYLPRDASGDEVLKAIQAVAAGEAVCRGSLCSVLFRYFEREASGLPNAAVRRKLGLTRREQQLIPLLARGLTNKEIANHFSLSEQTIKNHLHRMKNKVGAGDRLDIVQLYRVQGFLV